MMGKKKQPDNPMDNYINELIDKRLEEWDTNLTKEDAVEIVKSIMPQLEELVAKVVLKHLRALLDHSTKKLKQEG